MTHSFEGTTLALQHYYDIHATSRKLPLLTVYQAHEQPFGQKMAVWMTAYHDDFELPEETSHRLDEALLKNRAIRNPHILRVLDYGTSEGASFVVTDAISAISLRSRLLSSGPLPLWQVLRLLDQLTGLVIAAHRQDFRDLCLTSDNIFITDDDRFEIITGPLGIGLHRHEVLKIKNISISPDLLRHIAPWEFSRINPVTGSRHSLEMIPSETPSSPQVLKENVEESSKNTKNIAENTSQSDFSFPDESLHSITDTPLPTDDEDDPHPSHESIQEITPSLASLEDFTPPSTPPNGECPDMFNLASIVYEALCAQHPYFNDSLCDAALSFIHAAPTSLKKRIEISDELDDLIMQTLLHPKRDGENAFLCRFAELCPKEEREKAHVADKIWLNPPKTTTSGKSGHPTRFHLKHPLATLAIAVGILLLVTIGLTWHFAHYHHPVDLFALPEIIPTSPNGVDVVLTSNVIPPNAAVYIVSIEDGTPMKIGTMPFIYRQQSPGAKLQFLIADDLGNATQVPVTVRGENGLMLVPVELNW